jgi:hypothetical protein
MSMSGSRSPVLFAFVILVLLPCSSQAQRGGGSRAVSAPHAAPARSAAGPARMGVSRARVGPVASRSPMVARSATGSTRRVGSSARFQRGHFGFRRNCFGFSCRNQFLLNSGLGFPFLGYPLYDPFYADYYQSGPAEQPATTGDNREATDLQLAVEMQRLSDEVEELRDQRAPQPVMTRVPPQDSISAQPPSEATTFVFRDGHRVVTQNFAIVDHTLWILSQHTAKKIPLADLDRRATEQVNSANGVDFHLP